MFSLFVDGSPHSSMDNQSRCFCTVCPWHFQSNPFRMRKEELCRSKIGFSSCSVWKDVTSDSYYSNDSNKSIFTNNSKLLFLDILLLGYCVKMFVQSLQLPTGSFS